MKDYQKQFQKETGHKIFWGDGTSYGYGFNRHIEWLAKKLDYADQAIIGYKMIIKAKDKELEKLKGE